MRTWTDAEAREMLVEAYLEGVKHGLIEGMKFYGVAGLGLGVIGTMLTQFIFHWSLR